MPLIREELKFGIRLILIESAVIVSGILTGSIIGSYSVEKRISSCKITSHPSYPTSLIYSLNVLPPPGTLFPDDDLKWICAYYDTMLTSKALQLHIIYSKSSIDNINSRYFIGWGPSNSFGNLLYKSLNNGNSAQWLCSCSDWAKLIDINLNDRGNGRYPYNNLVVSQGKFSPLPYFHHEWFRVQDRKSNKVLILDPWLFSLYGPVSLVTAGCLAGIIILFLFLVPLSIPLYYIYRKLIRNTF